MTGIEPAPSGFTGQRSNQLSYIHHSGDRLFYFVLPRSRLPPKLERRSAPVTISATNLAFGDFLLDHSPSYAISNHLRHVFALQASDMVELEHHMVRFTAVDARVAGQVSVTQPLIA
jgi:hypothetical protein